MLGSRRLDYSEHGRPFWLLVAIAVTLLVNVSTTVSQAATARSLVEGVKRDVGAIRAQLEQVDPAVPDASWRAVTFNADPGDGGPAFRRQSLATMLHAARRRGDRLLAGYQASPEAGPRRLAQQLRRQLADLERQIGQQGVGADPWDTAHAAGRGRLEALLDEVDHTLEQLGEAPRPSG
jgi:hypothetical protein